MLLNNMKPRIAYNVSLAAAFAALAYFSGGVTRAADEWHAASGPLMTRWSKDVTPKNALSEYPRPQMVRKEWLSLNGLWDYSITDLNAGQFQVFDGKILVPYPIESALSGVMKPLSATQRLWYHRTFKVPKSWSGNRILLHFGAVDWEAKVRVNGREIGTHQGGYDGFTFDITSAMNPLGEKPRGEQNISVAVFDPTDKGDQPRGKQTSRPGGIYYTPTSGIWQTVWLEPVPDEQLKTDLKYPPEVNTPSQPWGTPGPPSIESLKLTPDIDAGVLKVEVRGREGHPAAPAARPEALALPGYSIRLTATARGKKTVRAEGPLDSEIILPIKNAELWTPDHPFLYDLQVDLLLGKRKVDSVKSYFGMRKISLGKDEAGKWRILLNNKFVFQVGPLDQGFWPDGLYTAPTDEALRFDIETMKKLGFNMARKHVKVEPERWYYWADKLGLMVWQDMPSGFNQNPKDESRREFETELRRMIEGRRDHPSIVVWVVFNEGWGQHDTPALTGFVKQLDPSRLVDNASGWTDKGVGDLLDMHHYPEPAAPKPDPNRASVLSEFGGLGMRVEGHMWQKGSWGYQGMLSASDQLTRRYARFFQNIYTNLVPEQGLNAAIYTQLTDVETESNGLLTYDRAVTKPDLAIVSAANQGRFLPLPPSPDLISTAQEEPGEWRYTTTRPGADWFQPGFEDSTWKKGRAGFGTSGGPVHTQWRTDDIWLRREIILPDNIPAKLAFSVFHDEDVEIYLNGVPAASATGFTTAYVDLPVSDAGRAALKPGKNVIAVHCHQTVGGQFIDVGITRAAK